MKAVYVLKFPVFLLSFFSIYSCEKLVEVDPPITTVNQGLVYENDAQAIAVLTGIYTNLSMANFDFTSGITSTSYICSLSADELIPVNLSNQERNAYYNNSLTAESQGIWARIYNRIYVTNAAIDGLSKSSGLTGSIKQQLLGEAKFIRALHYFYLVNLFGAVPLQIQTDSKANSKLPRSDVEVVYQQIIEDLKDAQKTMSSEYLDGTLLTTTPERVRPTAHAARALLARVYLYLRNYSDAEEQASAVINNTTFFGLVGIDSVFLKNNREAIWQLMPTGTAATLTANTKEGKFFIPITNVNDVYLNNELVNSFQEGDQRKVEWIGTFSGFPYPRKYKIGAVNSVSTEYSIVLRLAEVYLIRAEARANLGKLTGPNSAKEDLDIIRNRAGLSGTNASSLIEIEKAILNERRFELFTEMGHRWLDLKRTGTVDQIMQQVKGSNWQTTDQLYPLPKSEIVGNVAIAGHQNPGYN